MGGGGDGGRREGSFEHHGFRRQLVDVRAGCVVEAVGTQVVGAQRVDRDQDDVWARVRLVSLVSRIGRTPLVRPIRAAEERDERSGDDRDDHGGE